MAHCLTEQAGRHAIVVPDHRHPSKWAVVTARMKNPPGSADFSTAFPHDGPNDNLTLAEAEKQCARWEKYLAALAASDVPNAPKKRSVRAPTRYHTHGP